MIVFVLYRTGLGITPRAVGEHARAIGTNKISVIKVWHVVSSICAEHGTMALTPDTISNRDRCSNPCLLKIIVVATVGKAKGTAEKGRHTIRARTESLNSIGLKQSKVGGRAIKDENDVKVIDCQCHWYPRAYFEAIRGRSSYPRCSVQQDGYHYEPRPGETWTIPPHYVELDMQFEDMERSGVDIMVSSPAVYGDVSGLEQVEAIEIAQLFNEAMGAAQRTYLGRYFGIAVLPLQDPASAVRLLDDAVLRLGIKAVLLHSNINRKPIDQPAMWPVFKRIQDHSIPIFLHPTRSIAADDLPHGLEVTLGYIMDTSVAALSLIYGGVLDAFPELRIVHPHVGGVLPYILGRVEKEDNKPWSGDRSVAQPVFSYMRRFYTDTVSNHPGALRLAIDTYGLDHILFASDYPYWDVSDGIDFIQRNLDTEDAAEVLCKNAHELLKLLGD